MNKAPLLFLGALIAFGSAWMGLVFFPNRQLKDLGMVTIEATGQSVPAPYSGQQEMGRRVYAAEGCVYCHTQQVRGGKYVNDIERGWGANASSGEPRRSHPRDYIHDYPLLLGTMRTGPDLFNIGFRQDNRNWHHAHLYDPQIVVPGSIMSPYRFLYEKRKIVGQPSADALRMDYIFVSVNDPSVLPALKAAGFTIHVQRGGRYGGPAMDAALLMKVPGVTRIEPYIEEGYEIVPTERARALVAYLVEGLKHEYPIIEPATPSANPAEGK